MRVQVLKKENIKLGKARPLRGTTNFDMSSYKKVREGRVGACCARQA